MPLQLPSLALAASLIAACPALAADLTGRASVIDGDKYSKGQYAKEQAAAKAERRGIWQGEFEQPCIARAARTKRAPAC